MRGTDRNQLAATGAWYRRRLVRLATTDTLTGIANRGRIAELATLAIADARERGAPLCTPPLLERAEVRYRDLYSLRWTFVSLARASGEAAFNVSRMIGQARSVILDTIYAHTVDSGLAGISESVTERVGLNPTPHPEPPRPIPPSGAPRLRVIEGGRSARTDNQRDIRKTIENALNGHPEEGASD